MILRFYGFSLILFFCLTFTGFVNAQEYLLNEIKFVSSSENELGEIMDRLANEQGFYFSYQSSLIDLDKTVSAPSYEGNVAGFLQTLLGEDYEFKEHEDYVIIKYAPGKLDVEIDKVERLSIIKGQVKDLQSGESVPFASIYEKNSLTSALSDENGDFELKFKKEPYDPIWLAISKEAYRDTSFVILPTIDVGVGRDPKKLRYFPEDSSTEKMEDSYLGRLLIGFRQRVQRLNLGGFFVESPVQVSLTPGLSSRGVFSSQMINNFSLNVLGGYTAGVEGLEIAGIFNINQKNVELFQVAGIFNMTGGSVEGFQAAGILNQVYGDLRGFQTAGIFNHVHGSTRGMQVGGIYNHTEGVSNIQMAGLLNATHQSTILQIAGLANRITTSSGKLQIAGLYNHAPNEVEHQISGLINRAGKVSGIQLSGLLNIAQSSDYPIGLINFIEDGQRSLSLGLDETGFTQIAFRSGGKKLYGLVGAGIMVRSEENLYGLDLGLGWHAITKNLFSLDIEFLNRQASDFISISNNSSLFRFIPGYNFGSHLKLFAGPTIGYSVYDVNWTGPIPGLVIADTSTENGNYALHIGLTGGVRYVF